jgi:hypothetical protein
MLAYKYVIIMILMAKVNYYAPRMHLPIDIPVREEDIRSIVLSTPKMGIDGGCLQVKNYRFTFGDSRFFGKSIIIVSVDQYGKRSFGIPIESRESSVSAMERASQMKYLVNTNDIYRMATNWLVAMDIDVEKMEKVKSPAVDKYPIFHSSRGDVPNPILNVEWSSGEAHDMGRVVVVISAVTGELLELRNTHGSFNKNTTSFIKDSEKLAAISDEEFLKYSTLERSNLLVRFADLHCTNMYCPGVDAPVAGVNP